MARKKSKRTASSASPQPVPDFEHSVSSPSCRRVEELPAGRDMTSPAGREGLAWTEANAVKGTGTTRVIEEGAVSGSHFSPGTMFLNDPARAASAVIRGESQSVARTTVVPQSSQAPSTPTREHWTTSFGTGTPARKGPATSTREPSSTTSYPVDRKGPATSTREPNQASFHPVDREGPATTTRSSSRRLSQVTFDDVVNVIDGHYGTTASTEAPVTMDVEEHVSEGLSGE